jgi:hypothetical protein
VDQVQVQPVQPEPVQRPLERTAGVTLAGVGDPQLRGDEQLGPRDVAGADGATDGGLVLVGGGVDVPVTGGQRVCDDALSLLGGYRVDAEAEDRHLHTVVQRNAGDLGG